jgi:hypothetical protein
MHSISYGMTHIHIDTINWYGFYSDSFYNTLCLPEACDIRIFNNAIFTFRYHDKYKHHINKRNKFKLKYHRRFRFKLISYNYVCFNRRRIERVLRIPILLLIMYELLRNKKRNIIRRAYESAIRNKSRNYLFLMLLISTIIFVTAQSRNLIIQSSEDKTTKVHSCFQFFEKICNFEFVPWSASLI